MPTSPGILWTKKGGKFNKSIMTSGHSLKAQQWLAYQQKTGTFNKKYIKCGQILKLMDIYTRF